MADQSADEPEMLLARVQQLENELAQARRLLARLYELRIPLTPLKGFVRTLLDDVEEEWYTREDRREFYTIIEENLVRMERLVYELQDGSYRKITEVSEIVLNWQHQVDIHEIIKSVVADSQGRTDKHTLILDLDLQQVLVETDPDQFEIIVTTLIRDGIKYSPDGGDIRIITRLEAPGEEYPFGSLLLQVADCGVGIDMQDLRKVGTPMGVRKSTVKVPVGGIFQVKLIVEAHHGIMWPESEGRGKGTTVNVRIPVKQPKSVS